ncbi:MAG: tRNA (guanosine(37)-N1)-methyltransferase TrmD [Erysipelotrichaceae bacterium]|nr:tRNA (guanosine(37)-N1)-methyltransferase TrmD [Erysipelotrichaceae bacterium]
MKITILTIAPEQFDSFLKTPLVSRSISAGLLDLKIKDIRDYAPGSFRKVDDSPYGGGAGMLLRYQPLHDALIDNMSEKSHSILLAPCGKTYKQKDAHRLSKMEDLILICGHYEGFDHRFYEETDEMLSIGDYILCGGELPSMILTESILRLLDGSMKKESVIEESFEEDLLEYPQYTKPSVINDKQVPEILLSGNHEAIRKWRYEKAKEMTEKLRPDLLKKKDSIEDVEPSLKTYIEENILPCYRDYEKSHNIDHIRKVIENSFDLIKGLDVNVDMVYSIAAYHDIGIRFGRKDHHITSGKWLFEDKKLRNWFDEQEILLMKEAIEDHRASSDHEPRSVYGRIVAEADRDIDPYRIIERCVQFETNSHPDADMKQAYEYIMAHLDEKYSRHGYLKLWMPCKKNEEGLETLRRWMENGEIEDIVMSYLEKDGFVEIK